MLVVVAGLFFGLASKLMVVTLPCVMLLLDVWPLGRIRNYRDLWPRTWEKTPLFALMAGAGVLTFVSQGLSGAVSDMGQLSVYDRIANASVGCCAYLRLTFWPADLAILYPIHRGPRPIWQLATALALLAVITWGFARLRHTRPYLLVGWFWFLGTLVPVIGFVQIGSQAYADRYSYLPQIGLLFAVVWASADVLRTYRVAPTYAIAGTAAVASVLLMVTQQQLGYWKSALAVWEHTVFW